MDLRVFEVAALDPISQFNIKTWLPMSLFGMDISITNSVGFMALGCALVVLFFSVASSRGDLVPSRLQSIGELGYGFIADMIRSIAGEEGLKFFAFVFTLFFFILAANLVGMSPYAFTTTSQLAVTATLSVLVIAIVIIYGLWKNGFGFFGLFAPPLGDMPAAGKAVLYTILIPIEIISFVSRPLTLALRLFANMLAGHIALKLFAGFAVMLASAGGVWAVGSILPFTMGVALNALEFLVAGLQAFVFSILTCVYLNDALHPGHH
ncbi:MAG: F0F1 ATP synthase subunit A [Pseudomonadota bacterium]